MKKITTIYNNNLIVDDVLMYNLLALHKDKILYVKNTKIKKQTSFYISNTNIGLVDDKYKVLSQALCYKHFKMYGYKITIKRKSHFLTSDFEIVVKHQQYKTTIKYYLFDISL